MLFTDLRTARASLQAGERVYRLRNREVTLYVTAINRNEALRQGASALGIRIDLPVAEEEAIANQLAALLRKAHR